MKKGRLHSADLEMNLLSATILLGHLWTSFLVEGSIIDMIALVLSGLARMPSELMM
jgi:hypothetical protein